MKNFLFLPLMLLLSLPVHAVVNEIDSIAAVVDDDVITRSELDTRLDLLITQLTEKGTKLPARQVLERQMLERMVIEKLQLAQAEQLGIQVDDEELNKIITRAAAQNNLTLLQFREALEKEGTSFASFREEIRNEVIISRLKAKRVTKRINVSPQEIDNLLEQQRRNQSKNEEFRLQHILISLPSDASPEHIAEAQNKIAEIESQLKNGADFSNLAISHSAGPKALEGGDIGWRRLAQLPNAFAEAVQALQQGEISGPVRSASGFHLLKVLEKRGEQRHLIRQVDSRHILIANSPLVSAKEAKERLQRLRERILAGEDFAELARAHSDDGSAAKGGDLGWFNPADFVEPFRRTVDRIKPGEISQPFETQFGWHIVQVKQWRDFDNTEKFERNRAFKALKERKIEEETELWLRRLRDEAYIEIRLNQ